MKAEPVISQVTADNAGDGRRKTSDRRSSSVWSRLIHSPGGVIGAALVLLALLCALFAPWISPHSAMIGDLLNRLDPPAWVSGGNSQFLLGTDPLGRDLLSRIIYGARISLYIGAMSIFISIVIGVPVGLVAGFYRGWVDDVLMRIADIMLTFPFILFAILVMALFGPGVNKMVLILGVTGWVGFARVVRGQVLTLRELDYVVAARIIGASNTRIIVRHVLPSAWSPIIVLATLNIAVNILVASGLSFLGLGVDPSIPDWGNMLAQGQLYLTSAWWVDTFPGIALMLTVLGFNLLGDWLRDITDPLQRHN